MHGIEAGLVFYLTSDEKTSDDFDIAQIKANNCTFVHVEHVTSGEASVIWNNGGIMDLKK